MIKETEIIRGKKAYEIDNNLILWHGLYKSNYVTRRAEGRMFLISSVGLNLIGLNN